MRIFLLAVAGLIASAISSSVCAQIFEIPPPAIRDILAPDIREVSMSPSGRFLAVAQSRPRAPSDFENFNRWNRIMVYDAEGEFPPRKIDLGAWRGGDFQWISDDQFIAHFEYLDIFRSGRTIYFVPGSTKPVLVDRETGDLKPLIEDGSGEVLRIAPDDPDHIIIAARFEKRTGLYRLNLKTGKREELVRGARRSSYFVNSRYDPVLRLDFGRRNGFVRYQRSIDGGKSWIRLTDFTRPERANLPPLFAPVASTDDPGRVLIIAPRRGDGPTGVYEYDVINDLYTGTIFEHESADVFDYIEDEGAKKRPRVVWYDRLKHSKYLDKEYQRVQERLETFFDREFSITIQSWSDDDRVLLVFVEGVGKPGEYFRYVREENKLQRLFNTRPRTNPNSVGHGEILEATMSDGEAVYSYVIHPVHDREKKAPLIILPHGGPEGRDYYNYTSAAAAQVFASRGYRVIQPQFRGGGGYGQAWAKKGHGEFGRRMQADLFESAQKLVDRGVADWDNTCIWGWSYGGYAAAAATFLNADKVSCAVVGAGIVDLQSILKWEKRNDDTGGAAYRYWSRAIGDQETDADRIDAVSPRQNVESINRPILLLHGDADDIVPVMQARAFKKAMARAGKSDLLEYVEYENVGHDPSTEIWADVLERSLAFFEEHLEK